jgi:hypothetical protein
LFGAGAAVFAGTGLAMLDQRPAAAVTFPGSGEAFSSTACQYSDITRDWLYKSAWKFRARTGYNSSGYGLHPKVNSFRMHQETHTQIGKVARDLHWLGNSYGPAGAKWSLTSFGCGGAKHCKRGYHRYGAAIDITKVSWGSDRFVDMNVHGRDSRVRLRKRYLAVLAMSRKHFGRVLHTYNDPDGSHKNHIHLDRGRKAVAMSWNVKDDVTIVQWAARDLAGVSLSIDGIWGPKTQSAYNTLRTRFKMTTASGGCFNLNPTTSAANQRTFMDLIGKTAMADRNAGYYTMTSRPNCPV